VVDGLFKVMEDKSSFVKKGRKARGDGDVFGGRKKTRGQEVPDTSRVLTRSVKNASDSQITSALLVLVAENDPSQQNPATTLCGSTRKKGGVKKK